MHRKPLDTLWHLLSQQKLCVDRNGTSICVNLPSTTPITDYSRNPTSAGAFVVESLLKKARSRDHWQTRAVQLRLRALAKLKLGLSFLFAPQSGCVDVRQGCCSKNKPTHLSTFANHDGGGGSLRVATLLTLLPPCLYSMMSKRRVHKQVHEEITQQRQLGWDCLSRVSEPLTHDGALFGKILPIAFQEQHDGPERRVCAAAEVMRM